MIDVVAVDPHVRERVADWLAANLGRSVKLPPGVYIAEGALAAEHIRKGLEPLLASRDRLAIVKAATEAVWRGMVPEAARWLAESFPGSITERVPDPAGGTARR